ncbi:hypothetical protein LX32DRAFT_648877 [Colletotrichum zoysiae]|uniref:Heterokaryon incompatibility domain-containing protein n=1 Tax=Colletotrichum zoysiae TaxID=1216348 RepID=A0AAD9HT94_9PEZI|nr:hypothetical protein LX32DRAFT_648877 [Colletotrichum zoysiae]
MFNWHEPTCRNPDVVFPDGLDVPYCQSCGETAAVDKAKNEALDGTPSQPPSNANFELRWPSSLPFVEVDEASHLAVDGELPTTEIGSSSTTTDQDQQSSFDLVPAKAVSPGGASVASSYESLFARRIRILRLLPGAYGDPIRGDLRTVDLASKPEYEALSYTWADQSGDTSRSQLIFLGKRWDIMAITETHCILQKMSAANLTSQGSGSFKKLHQPTKSTYFLDQKVADGKISFSRKRAECLKICVLGWTLREKAPRDYTDCTLGCIRFSNENTEV